MMKSFLVRQSMNLEQQKQIKTLISTRRHELFSEFLFSYSFIKTMNEQSLCVNEMCSARGKGEGVVLHSMGYVGMCCLKGYGFSAVLVINWVLIWPF